MNVPTRLLVLQRLTALLEETTYTFNGQTLSLAGAVFRGRNLVGDESKPWPIISILEAPRPDIALYAGDGEAMKDRWLLLIEGICENDLLNPSDAAYTLHAAVEEQLCKVVEKKQSGSAKYPEHYLLGNLITGIEISPPVIRPPGDKASAAAFFFLPVRVGIATRFGQPYTQTPD